MDQETFNNLKPGDRIEFAGTGNVFRVDATIFVISGEGEGKPYGDLNRATDPACWELLPPSPPPPEDAFAKAHTPEELSIVRLAAAFGSEKARSVVAARERADQSPPPPPPPAPEPPTLRLFEDAPGPDGQTRILADDVATVTLLGHIVTYPASGWKLPAIKDLAAAHGWRVEVRHAAEQPQPR